MVTTVPRATHPIGVTDRLDRLAAVRDDIAHFEAGLDELRVERGQLITELLRAAPVDEVAAAAGMTRTSLYRAARSQQREV